MATFSAQVVDLVGAECSDVIGLSPRNDEWLSGKQMAGVWFSDVEVISEQEKINLCLF